jgi:hypothetical protein
MTWQPGRDKIAELIDPAELQQVTADQAMAELLPDDARPSRRRRGGRDHDRHPD